MPLNHTTFSIHAATLRRLASSVLAISILAGTLGCSAAICKDDGESVASKELMEAKDLMDKKQYREALGKLDVAAKAFPSSIVYYHRGQCYSELAMYPQAIAEYGKSLELKPDFSKARFHRAEAYIHDGKPAKGLLDLSILIEKQPNDLKCLKVRGRLHEMMGHYKEAIADFTSAIKISPKDMFLYKDRAKAYGASKQDGLALNDFTKCIELSPKWSNNYYNRGDVYLRLGKANEAIKDFTKYLDFSSKEKNNARAYLKRAEAYEKLGNMKEAKTDRQRAAVIDDFEV